MPQETGSAGGETVSSDRPITPAESAGQWRHDNHLPGNVVGRRFTADGVVASAERSLEAHGRSDGEVKNIKNRRKSSVRDRHRGTPVLKRAVSARRGRGRLVRNSKLTRTEFSDREMSFVFEVT